MKKALWSIAAAALFILSLTGCAGTAEPVQTEDRPQITAEVPAESTAPVENEPILFSAGEEQPVEDSTDGAEDSAASEEPTVSPEPVALATTLAPKVAAPAPEETPASVPTTPVPQETPAPAKAVMRARRSRSPRLPAILSMSGRRWPSRWKRSWRKMSCSASA